MGSGRPLCTLPVVGSNSRQDNGESSQHGSQFAETESQLGKEPNDDARKGEGAAGYRGLTPGRSGASDGVFRTSREAPERSAGAPGCWDHGALTDNSWVERRMKGQSGFRK